MMLSFEFFIERTAPNQNRDSNNNTSGGTGGGTFRVVHKVGVTDANGITNHYQSPESMALAS